MEPKKLFLDWDSSPPERYLPSEFFFLRSKGAVELKGICLSPNLIGHVMHYYKGRSYPCVGLPDCEACPKKIKKQWESFFVIWNPKSRMQAIGVLTAGPAKKMQEQRRVYANLKGLHVRSWRPDGRDNGRIAIEFPGYEADSSKLPVAPNLGPVLEKIWGVAEIKGVAIATQADLEKELEKVDRFNEHLSPSSNGNGFLHHD